MLEVSDLHKAFHLGRGRRGANHVAVNNCSFDVRQGELFTLLGPSGCGKTTTLRCIAGLEQPDSGRISVEGEDVFDSSTGTEVRANDRGFGMVFQSYAIWPHMNVFDNVAFPLKVRGRKDRLSKSRRRERVVKALDAVRLGELGARPATDLSGGQQQRLALARALVMQPPLLLLDEPLSNLDALLREEMRVELKRLQRDLGITALYVTHDQVEALAMSSRIAIMNKGNIEQVGSPREIYESPRTRFVAEFIGTTNLIEGRFSTKRRDLLAVQTDVGEILVRAASSDTSSDNVLISIRPEQIELAPTESSPFQNAATVLEGTVLSRSYLGESVEHIVTVGPRQVVVRCNPNISVAAGRQVALCIDPDSAKLVPIDSDPAEGGDQDRNSNSVGHWPSGGATRPRAEAQGEAK